MFCFLGHLQAMKRATNVLMKVILQTIHGVIFFLQKRIPKTQNVKCMEAFISIGVHNDNWLIVQSHTQYIFYHNYITQAKVTKQKKHALVNPSEIKIV